MADLRISTITPTVPYRGSMIPMANPADSAARTLLVSRLRNGVWNVEDSDYGAVPDEFYQDGSATSGSATFTSNTANFVAGDVGKTITILRAGVSSNQDLHTTISVVTNSTTVTLSHSAGRTQASCRFYISRAGAQTTALQAAIDACAAAGGGTVILPGVGYLTGGLVLKRRVVVRGMGMRATYLHLVHGANVPVFRNDVASNDNAMFTGLMDMMIDGAAQRQSDITTTLNGAYTAGASSITLTDASAFLPSGSILIGTNRLHYQSITTNTLNNVTGGTEGTTDANASNGATVTQHKSHGIYFATLPYSGTQGTYDECFDAHQLVMNVMVKNAKGDGISMWGRSENRIINCYAEYNNHFGIRTSFDTWVSDTTAGFSGRAGFYIRYSEVNLTNCKSFFSGGNVGAEGWGFFFEGPTTVDEGTKKGSSLDTQDNKADGYYLRNCERVILSGTASSNGTSSVGTYAGICIDGSTHCIIDLLCTERVAVASNSQQNAIRFLETGSIKNDLLNIRIMHGASGGSAVGTAIKSGSVYTGGINLTINGMGGIIFPAYATPYTPDPYAATVIQMAALTQVLTINAPANAHIGCELEFRLIQGGSGGYAVTFDAAYVFNPVYSNNNNSVGKILRCRFRYDGSVWNLIWQSQSATAGNYWT